MTDNSSTPIDLRIKRKREDIDEYKSSTKKKSRNNYEYEIPLDLSIKSQQQEQHHVFNPINSSSTSSSSSIPFYDPTNLLFNSSALLYDLFLANLNSYYQQQQQQQQQQQHRVNIESTVPISKPTKQQTINSSRNIKDNSTSKQESYACSCGEKYSNVAHLVSHLKITNHNAQLSSTHDEVAKLVRGQDIWLSRDTNPANQILKCLRCSLSFETLPDLTAHMMKTNHFTQLLPSSSSTTATTTAPSTSSYHHSNLKQQQQQQQQHSPTKLLNPPSLIRSTCLICSQQFAREVDLVDHIQHYHQIRFNCTTCGMYFENENLYKEHILKEMHHRNGKANRNRDYFLNQCKTLQKRSLITKTERPKSRSSIDKDVEQVTLDLIDRVVKNDEESKEFTTKTTTNANALSLLQNFVIKQTPTTNRQSDLNNNYDDENTNLSQNETSLSSNIYHHHHEKISNNLSLKSNESPLVSLEKMLSYPTTTIQSLSSTINDNGTMSNLSNNSIMTIKKKKFDKYRLFAEKMLRSTLS
ncbi:unnamed protein product [Rotaria sordida]|uniref:C2H2-type domain-containing protein n=1 Tax=Rotaria sordida TaxID=392033 RepID=A0A818JUX8_9BILA|nr:unnamed protein product [Rotaria sordida]CAF3547849.1 unnamed protein product [Rotaria sordida]